MKVFIPTEAEIKRLVRETIQEEIKSAEDRIWSALSMRKVSKGPLVGSDDDPIEMLNLSVRAMNCMKNAEIKNIGQLASKTEQELLKYRNFGKKSLMELRWALNRTGRDFAK